MFSLVKMSSAIVTGAIAVPVLVRGAARPRVAKGVAVIARSGSRVLAARVPPASARVEMSRAAWTVARGTAIDSEVRVEYDEVKVASKAPLAASVTALSALFLSAMPAMAELDADGVPETSIVTTIFFTIAVLLLGVITVGILYLSAREALDRKEERDARLAALKQAAKDAAALAKAAREQQKEENKEARRLAAIEKERREAEKAQEKAEREAKAAAAKAEREAEAARKAAEKAQKEAERTRKAEEAAVAKRKREEEAEGGIVAPKSPLRCAIR